MASLSVHCDFLAVSSVNCTFLFSREECDRKILDAPPIKQNNSEDRTVLLSEADSGGVCSEISPTGQYLVVCIKKSLYLWDLHGNVLLSSRLLSRSVSKVRFISSQKGFVVGDKSGDVYYYSVCRPNDKGTLLLGHLSVILDLLVSVDEKYIITCDRDEKIRVSEFPNCYNIHGYCLGHSEFVSVVKFLPHRQEILISGSGDGTIRLWNYGIGAEISCISLKEVAPLKGSSQPVAVTNLDAFALGKNDSIIVCSVSCIPGILTFRVTEGSIRNLEVQFVHYLETYTDPTCLRVCGQCLWILSEDPVKSPLSQYDWVDGKFSEQRDSKMVELVDRSKDDLKESLLNQLKDKSYPSYLYKKRYDNIQDYLEKKKARLEGTRKNP